MTKQTIAVDVDDVLAVSAEGWVEYSNKKWGTNLTIEDYQEDWGTMWQVDHEEMLQRATHMFENSVVASFGVQGDARAVLQELAQRYRLVITTSRSGPTNDDTLEWLDTYCGDIFEEIHLAGFYDSGTRDALEMTKADLHRQIGAEFIIDDHPKHCFAAAEAGIQAILFGDYIWNRNLGILPKNVTRARTWKDILEYFDGLK